MRTLRNRYIALGTMLLLALCCLPSAKAQKTYQPTGSHVIYGDGSTDFYYEVTNPSTGQQTSFTVFFDSAIHEATVINAGVYAPVEDHHDWSRAAQWRPRVGNKRRLNQLERHDCHNQPVVMDDRKGLSGYRVCGKQQH